MRTLLCLLLALAATARANYAEEAYAATFKLHNVALNGTCSLYRRPGEEAIYLVTTQHQMEGAKGDTCVIVLREPQPDGSYKRNDFPIVIRKEGKPTWVRHPKLDLAVLKLTTPPKGTYATLPTSEIADEARLAAAKPAIGSPFLLLSFPHGIESVRAGFPIARQAIFAARSGSPRGRRSSPRRPCSRRPPTRPSSRTSTRAPATAVAPASSRARTAARSSSGCASSARTTTRRSRRS